MTNEAFQIDYDRLKADNDARKAAEHTARLEGEADKAASRAEFWAPIHLPEIPFLQTLYDAVLTHSEKRMPKWKFRLAPDVMLEIQPKLTRAGRLFHWQALKCEGANEKMLASPRDRVRPHITSGGTLRDVDGGAGYVLKATSIGWSTDLNRVAGLALHEQIVAAFREGRFDKFTPSMLGSHCLICGKGLTDPVSQARFIGPECFGSASVHIPWLRDVSPASELAAIPMN
jgi:hypothetical protein